MGMGSRMIVSSAYWGSSDSDDDDYYIPPITNMTCKKKTKVVVPVKKPSMLGKPLSNQTMIKLDHYLTRKDVVPCQRCIK